MTSSSGDERDWLWSNTGLLHLSNLAREMRRNGVSRVKIGEVEMEIGPLPPVAQPEAAPAKDELICPCGHHMVTEHNETGCLHGCAVELCASKDGEP